MGLGVWLALLMRALPELLALWRRRGEVREREAVNDEAQDFQRALAVGDMDRAAVLLERRMRNARAVRERGAGSDESTGR
jgi:hypothetical protein